MSSRLAPLPVVHRTALARRWPAFAALAGALLTLWLAQAGETWNVTRKIPLGASVVRLVADPNRPWLYAVARQESDILFVDLTSGAVQKRLYIGKDPTDCDLDATGNFLFAANKGPGTGVPGSWRIGVISLADQTLIKSFVTQGMAVNVTAGRAGRLYYNPGFEGYGGWALDTESGADLGFFAYVKTRMVGFSDKTRLFGQYIYDGNLGAMGAFDISTDQIALKDSLHYSPYPYGWDYENYSISGDDRRLGYGKIVFNSTNLLDQIVLLPEEVIALNYDGSLAFGQTAIWDVTTAAIHGDATKIAQLPFPLNVVHFDHRNSRLYAFNPADNAVYLIEPTTPHGIPHGWLTAHGLSNADAVEAEDGDRDGYSNLQEWIMDSDPTQTTAPLRLAWAGASGLLVSGTSSARTYTLQSADQLPALGWGTVATQPGSGGDLAFPVSRNPDSLGRAFYRILITVAY